MATQYANGQIVTSGLVLNFNAADKNSYPGSGTTWRDLSGNGYNGTLTNGPTFDSGNGGSILCDGVDDYIVSTTFTPNVTAKSFMAWCRLTSTTQQAGGLIGLMGDSGEPFDTIVYNETNDGWGFGSTGFSRTAWSGVKETSTTTWVMMAATYANSNYNLYRNGSLILNTTAYAALNYNFSSNIILGKRHGSGVIGPLGAYIANGLFYNRALTATEILQNYNAQKTRFGL